MTTDEWRSEPWYHSRLGLGVVGFDVVLTMVLVALTTQYFEELFHEPLAVPAGVIPWYIYLFAVLGALGFVFTTITVKFDRTTAEMLQFNFRLPAALPLGAGVFLFADVLFGQAAESGVIVIGLVFLSGLYVNLAYRQLGALAERFLPGTSDRDPEFVTDETEGSAEHPAD